ncbi:slipin family protein [Pseudonocardia nantongensis]|uniref:slipin family protein n=1 Tax=Pseudonocardia nantongensis TaxID=1181885 RepID=UPI00397CE7DB
MGVLTTLLLIVLLVGLLAGSSIRMVQQYERGIVLRFGRLLPQVRQPGLRLLIPVADRMRKVSIQTLVLDVPSQGAITRDNVTVGVDAVVYFRVEDPERAVINVQNYMHATSQVAQTSLRSVIGRADLDTLLSDRTRINSELREVIDAPTEEWGITIDRVEVKDISLPEGMRRSMSRQAEAERDRRARVISAEGELQASDKLSRAAAAMDRTPSALQLRLLQTMNDVAAEKNSTLVMPFPVELLRFLDRGAGGGGGAASATVEEPEEQETGDETEASAEPLPDAVSGQDSEQPALPSTQPRDAGPDGAVERAPGGDGVTTGSPEDPR